MSKEWPLASILIVEDERIFAKDLYERLTPMGYRPLGIASSGDEAIAIAADRCPDLVLMDIRIKGARDGIETAAVLRQRFGVPIIFLTAHSDEATLERAKATDPHGYLVKPLKSGELRTAIEVALHKDAMERRLRERERWFSTTLRSIGDAVITVDLAGRVTFMNPVAERLTGIAMKDGVGQPARDVIRLLDTEAKAVNQTPLDLALARREAVTGAEATLEVEGQASRLVSDSATPVLDRGELLGAVMVFRDITEQRLLQQQVELSDRLSSLGTMAAGVAHEINNPLAAVITNASFVEETLGEQLLVEASPSVRRRLEDALEAQRELLVAARQIATIVSDLKSFSRTNPPSPGLADIARTIGWAVRLTAPEVRPRAELTTTIEALPDVGIDEARLGQVLVNLILNAAQAMSSEPTGKRRIHVSAKLGEPGWVLVQITDTGVGIDADVLRHVFDPFFTTRANRGGTGLGLSICHGIVRSCGGEIEVTSESGEGTTVTLKLPVAAPAPASAPRAESRPPPARGRVLIVDDEPLVLRALSRALAEHDVAAVSSAADALARFDRGETFDVILCDVTMPGMSGVDLYRLLLQRDPALARRLVFITGGALSAQAEDFLSCVTNDRLDKPVDVAELRAFVRERLQQPNPPSSKA